MGGWFGVSSSPEFESRDADCGPGSSCPEDSCFCSWFPISYMTSLRVLEVAIELTREAPPKLSSSNKAAICSSGMPLVFRKSRFLSWLSKRTSSSCKNLLAWSTVAGVWDGVVTDFCEGGVDRASGFRSSSPISENTVTGSPQGYVFIATGQLLGKSTGS